MSKGSGGTRGSNSHSAHSGPKIETISSGPYAGQRIADFSNEFLARADVAYERGDFRHAEWRAIVSEAHARYKLTDDMVKEKERRLDSMDKEIGKINSDLDRIIDNGSRNYGNLPDRLSKLDKQKRKLAKELESDKKTRLVLAALKNY